MVRFTYGAIRYRYCALRVEEAILELYDDLLTINPYLNFQVSPFSIFPIPGTPQWNQLQKSGLLQFDDPSIFGGLWTPSVNTHYLTYKQISAWQIRLLQIGSIGGRTHFINTDFSTSQR